MENINKHFWGDFEETWGQTTQIHIFRSAGASAPSWRPQLSCVSFFTIFLFELALDVNMNVVGLDVRFLMVLVWLPYDF